METSLYISNEKLYAVTGGESGKRLAIRAYAETPLPAGTVINGTVTDEGAFNAALATLAGQATGKLRRVRLLLNSSQIYIKRTIMPKLSKKKLLELIPGEFSDLDRDPEDELIYDCMTLGDNGTGQGNVVFACAAKSSLIASYAELFAAQKIDISCIDTTHSALIKLMQLLVPADETFIVLSLDGNALDATLFVKNEFRFNNRTRLIADRGTAECTGEVSRMVSSIIQFNSSERSGQAIRHVYVLGARDTENAMLQSLTTAYDIPAERLTDANKMITVSDEAFPLSEYALAAGNLIGT